MKTFINLFLLCLNVTLIVVACSDVKKSYEVREHVEIPRTEHLPAAPSVSEAERPRHLKKQRPPSENYNTESYATIVENEFQSPLENPLSTFSIDVDNASYSNSRRFLMNGQLPPKNAVRIEEFINYFNYDYPQPQGEAPFSVTTEISDCPWNLENKLLHIGLQGRKMPQEHLPPSNLVFLLDVSGSMNSPDKLPLLKNAFRLLVNQLRKSDRVAVVVYAGASGLALPSTPGSNKQKIMDALNRLQAGGSTAGAAGIELAYQVADKYFVKGGNNRVILATDGDFNVGQSSDEAMVQLIESKRDKGIYLSVIGFGTGNYKDSKMEKLADNGNGNYAYIDNLKEAQKVLVNEMSGTLFTIAKDVKLQLEFNPAHVKAYRLVGYENRLLNKEDFNDDTKDAGELGAGHTVTALYELIPATSDKTVTTSNVDPLKYQNQGLRTTDQNYPDWTTIKLRFKRPEKNESELLTFIAQDMGLEVLETSDNFRFSAAVAGFGMLLRDSKFKANANYKMIRELAIEAKSRDENGYRGEMVQLVQLAEELDDRLLTNK